MATLFADRIGTGRLVLEVPSTGAVDPLPHCERTPDVVTDYRRVGAGPREAAADHADRAVRQGRHAGDDRLERSAEHTVEAVPDDLDDESVRRNARELAKQRRGRRIDEPGVERRTARVHRRPPEHDGLIREYAADPGTAEVTA